MMKVKGTNIKYAYGCLFEASRERYGMISNHAKSIKANPTTCKPIWMAAFLLTFLAIYDYLALWFSAFSSP